MSSQYELPVSDASAKAPARSGILTPASDNSLNLSDGASCASKKRKRDGSTMENLLEESFVVKPYPTTVFVKPRTLHPFMLLPRSKLPLSFLDIASSINPLPQSRLFETHVKILELEERMGDQPTVLIARFEDGRTLFAVEREDRGLYVLCKLGSWVNLQQLRSFAVMSRQQMPREVEKSFGRANLLQQNNTLPTATAESHKYDKKKRLAIEAIQSMVKRPSTPLSTDLPHAEAASQPPPESISLVVPEATDSPTITETPAQPTSAEIFENVRVQYLEALYSKASLAYFAKGPISRARAAFHLDYDSTLEMSDLVSFLESLILSNSVIEKKYRDGVPTCVSTIDVHDSGIDANGGPLKVKKRKSTKRVKPGRNGLYPSEDDLIRKWWLEHDDDGDSGVPGSTREEVAKNRISQLRIRETQLQLIVILEVLTLQPLASQKEEKGDDLPSTIPISDKSQATEKHMKQKKPENLSMVIDIHIDRLCIWQSIQAEHTKVPNAESQSAHSSTLTTGSKHTDNILRDFCVEVIAPFFSARLPERCAVINRKLGGPVAVAPPKAQLSKSASFSGVLSRPGAATKRPVPSKPRRSLQRVLTDERERRSMSRGPERAILLLRSVTMPSVPGIKRETSEVPSLSGIPLAESQSGESGRAQVIKSKQLARREVDLGSFTSNMNAKAAKQAKIDAELKDAISVLKRPNRELAGKALVETAERRSASAIHSRKSKKPVRNPLFQSVQISATPKTNRMRDAISRPQNLRYERPANPVLEAIPPSSLPRIPQSAIREEPVPRNPLFSAVQETPTRALPRTRDFLGIDGTPNAMFTPSSPLHMRRSSAQLFATIPASSSKLTHGSRKPLDVPETPVNKKSNVDAVHTHPFQSPRLDQENKDEEGTKSAVETTQKTTVVQEDSIYKSLGWEDDDVDDLI